MKQVGGEGETNWFSWLFKRNQRNGGGGGFSLVPSGVLELMPFFLD
jgi:hypothetical protein